MSHDAFISYAKEDRTAANAVCSVLEQKGIRCWIAPRDVRPGVSYAGEIVNAIGQSRVLVLVFSAHSNSSPFVNREVERAVSRRIPIVPFRIEDVPLSADMELYISSTQWLDASTPPSEADLNTLAKAVTGLLGTDSARPQPTAPVGKDTKSTPEWLENSLGNELVLIPQRYLPSGHTPHLPLYVSATCVTNREYLAFMHDGNPGPKWNRRHPERQTIQNNACPDAMLDHPVVYVTQEHARRFCDWLTQKERSKDRIGPEKCYTLPTYDQWKAFAKSAGPTDDIVTDRFWDPGHPQPTERVTWGKPSQIGLYCLFGNVFEWCLDDDVRTFHRKGSDPQQPSKAVSKPANVFIGGGWGSTRTWLRRRIENGTYGALWSARGWSMKDGGFRICLGSSTP